MRLILKSANTSKELNNHEMETEIRKLFKGETNISFQLVIGTIWVQYPFC